MASVKIQLNLTKGEKRTDYDVVSEVMDTVREEMEREGIPQPNRFGIRGDSFKHVAFIGYQTNAQRDVIRKVFAQAGHEVG